MRREGETIVQYLIRRSPTAQAAVRAGLRRAQRQRRIIEVTARKYRARRRRRK